MSIQENKQRVARSLIVLSFLSACATEDTSPSLSEPAPPERWQPSAPGSCNGGGTGVPPNECEWVTVELYIGGLMVSSWRVMACWG